MVECKVGCREKIGSTKRERQGKEGQENEARRKGTQGRGPKQAASTHQRKIKCVRPPENKEARSQEETQGQEEKIRKVKARTRRTAQGKSIQDMDPIEWSPENKPRGPKRGNHRAVWAAKPVHTKKCTEQSRT